MLQISKCNISFFIDSQAAIKALKTGNIRSKVVSSCHKELLALREQHNINLCWMPGHKNILGNEKADELAKRGAQYGKFFHPYPQSFKKLNMNRELFGRVDGKNLVALYRLSNYGMKKK